MTLPNLDLNAIRPPKKVIQAWAIEAVKTGDSSLYMRENYLLYGAREAALLICESMRGCLADHPGATVNVAALAKWENSIREIFAIQESAT